MKVKVNESFKGTFGFYNEKYHSVEPKVAGDDPFEVSDDVARIQIKNGVLVAVDAQGTVIEEPEEAKAPMEAPAEASYEKMSFTELKAIAKERGISTFGVKRTEIEAQLREYDAMPEIGAADPV